MVFEVFRKRQKEMLAVLVLVAMFSFIAGDFLYRFVRGDRDMGDPRYAEIWGKPVTLAAIEKLAMDRGAAQGVLERMMKSVGTNANYERYFSVYNPMIPQILQSANIEWPFAFLALEGKADRLGIQVTDDDVTQFLTQITGGKLTRDQFKESLSAPRRSGQKASDRGGETLSEGDLYRVVARDIKVRRAMDALGSRFDYNVGLDYWRDKMEDARALFTLEMVRIPVEKFVDDKLEPKEADLKTIYERYKLVEGDSEKNVVGFLQPAKANFEYASIAADKWLDQVQVTDAECKTYYDANPGEFREEPKLDPPPPPVGANKEGDKKGVAPKKEDVPAPPAKKPDEKKPESPKTDAKGKPDAKPASTDKKTSSLPAVNLLRTLAATSVYVPQDAKKDDKSKPVPPKVEEKKDDKKAPPTKTEEKKDDKKAPPAKADEKKNDKMAFPDDGKKVAPAPPQPPGAGQAKAGEGFQPPKLKSYAEVKPQIEKKLKLQKARKLLREKIDAVIKEKLGPFADQYILARRKWEDEHKGDMANFKPPAPPTTLEKLATDLRGDFHKIGPTSESDVRKMPGFGRLTAVGNIFNVQKLTNSAELETDIDENVFYVYWRTNLTEAKPLEFDAVRPQVVAIWRKEQARAPARKYADELSEKVKKDGFAKALEGTDYKPFQPGSFRRAMYISSGFNNPTRLSSQQRFPQRELPGVPDAKEPFLDAAVEMEEGDVKVIPGDEQLNFYVVKCVKREPPNFDEFAYEYEQFARSTANDKEMAKLRSYPVAAMRAIIDSGFEDLRRPARDEDEGRGRAKSGEPAPQ
jgi:hypothetical protein